MSTETVEKVEEKVVKAPREDLFSKKRRKLITNPMDDDNPITIQVLGICSALAVTIALKGTLVMALAVFFVLVSANVIISAIRKTIPNRIRIIVQLVVVASLVAVVDQVLKAYMYDVSKTLSVFVGLIITNCIIMGRLEAFAMGNKPYESALDGLGNGVGYGVILLIVAFFRELLGKGSLFDYKIIGHTEEYLINTQTSWLFGWYEHNNLMVLFPSAMFVIGIVIWVHRAWNPKLVDVS